MQELSLNSFIEGYKNGSITEVVAIGSKVYGKQLHYPSKIPSSQRAKYRVVWASV